MELDRHLEELPWRVNSVDVMVTDVVDAFRKWPWSQYDGVADENPNRVTILDLAVGSKTTDARSTSSSGGVDPR